MKKEFSGHIVNTDAGDIFIYSSNISDYEYDAVKLNYDIVGEVETSDEIVQSLGTEADDAELSEIKVGIISDIDTISSEDKYNELYEDVSSVMLDVFENDSYDRYDPWGNYVPSRPYYDDEDDEEYY